MLLSEEEGHVLGAMDLEVLAGAPLSVGWVLGACGPGGASGFREVQLGDLELPASRATQPDRRWRRRFMRRHCALESLVTSWPWRLMAKLWTRGDKVRHSEILCLDKLRVSWMHIYVGTVCSYSCMTVCAHSCMK
jgi:hypothetical protein